MQQTRVAFVGLGMGVEPHALSALDLRERMQVACAFSPSRARRDAFASKFPFPVCERLETILEDRSIEAVALITPPNTHRELTLRCAAAHKHVLLEKPLEVNTLAAEELVRGCEGAGVKLGVVLQYRHRAAVERLAGAIHSGELGSIVGASAAIRLWRAQSYYDELGRGTLARDGGGVLLTQGIHLLDVLLSLVGDAESVSSVATTTALHHMECEDLVCAAVRWKSGALGVVEATTAAYPGQGERIEIIGTRAGATLAGTALEIAWLNGDRLSLPEESGRGSGSDPMAFPHEWHRGVWSSFLDAVQTGSEPRVTGKEALRVHRFIDALLSSARSGAAVTPSGS